MIRHALLVSLALTFLAHCSSGGTTTTGTTEADPDASDDAQDVSADAEATEAAAEAATDSASDPPFACLARKITSPSVTIKPYFGDPPAGVGVGGGTVADGHYVLKRAGYYFTSRDTGWLFAQELWIKNGQYEYESDDEFRGLWPSAGTIRFKDDFMTLEHTCAKYSGFVFQYSAKGSDLALRLSDGQGHVYLFEMQKAP